MDRIQQMQIFQRVAQLGSFIRTAEQLGLPKTSVSEAVQQLETQLNVRLLNRTTRRVELTQDGMACYQRCVELLADFDDLQQLFQQQPELLKGVLRIDMPTNLAREAVIPALPQFLAQHPQLHIQLISTDRKVDLIAEGFDAVIRIGQLNSSSLIARPLALLPQVNCVSPAYLQKFGKPETLDDLNSHNLVFYSQQLAGKPDGFEYRQDGKTRFWPMSGAITVNNAEAYTAACLAGLGIIQLPEVAVRQLVLQGKLVQVLPEYQPAAMPISVLYAHRRQLSRRLKVFIDWLQGLINSGYN
ncbi:MAG: LysR family transcriptional regulator [Gammaproteobacteria bacterium]|nr:LysR family transcriptional regulator [Gammaproteobacteria bacterium]MBU2059387.1 LysR family transcriptional regulator [Gammaproteobacteria bacterium]MBU2175233.1 LysR family transcriptional regulator [Gammaproteobacteria bacterium]MBU2247441.1 LysR family transcriptional regulator [Gammaproteobacteria bacterium]MBU2346292.1 LysR family transcriptional regulator [Gammaproteobacteria bacterium]